MTVLITQLNFSCGKPRERPRMVAFEKGGRGVPPGWGDPGSKLLRTGKSGYPTDPIEDLGGSQNGESQILGIG